MYHALNCIREVAQKTDRVILFHSATGKDSIALLDLCYPHFKQVICVYMYMVKDLEHVNNYIAYALNKYPGIEFNQIPSYVLSQYVRDGVLGCHKDTSQRVYQLNHIVKMAKLNYACDWAIFGFKQSDSMNRRLMLRSYKDEMIYENTGNAYPLSKYTNADVLKYIAYRKLIKPVEYGKGQSQGTDVTNLAFLLYCRDKFPADYEKIKAVFPDTERIVFDYDNYNPDYDQD